MHGKSEFEHDVDEDDDDDDDADDADLSIQCRVLKTSGMGQPCSWRRVTGAASSPFAEPRYSTKKYK